jgi:hypothetical protein
LDFARSRSGHFFACALASAPTQRSALCCADLTSPPFPLLSATQQYNIVDTKIDIGTAEKLIGTISLQRLPSLSSM